MRHSFVTLATLGALALVPSCQPKTPSQPTQPLAVQASPSPAVALSTLSGLVKVPAGVISYGGGNVIAPGGGNVIAPGGGNVIAPGGGNVIAPGGGNVIAPGGGNIITGAIGKVIAAGAGNVISYGGGNVIAAGGGNVISYGGGNYALLLAASQVPLPGAQVFLTDVKGQPIPGIEPVTTDASGRYEIKNLPRGLTFLVVTRIAVPGGGTVTLDSSLATIATTGSETVTADLSLASTLTTAAIYQQAAEGDQQVVLGEHMEDTFQVLEDQFDAAIGADEDETLITIEVLVDDTSLTGTIRVAAEQLPELEAALNEAQNDLDAPDPTDEDPADAPAPAVAPVLQTGVEEVTPTEATINGAVTIKNGTLKDSTATEAISL